MKAKTVITGGAGFIGSHLAERLCSQGRRVVIVDNLSTGRVENIAHLLESPDADCTLIEANAGTILGDPVFMRDVEEVYHLAAAVGVKLIVDDPTRMIHTNTAEAAVVLEAAAKAGARVLVASSSEVYGKCPVLPLREDMELVYGPTTSSRWAYGLTKALDEHLALDFAQRRGLKAVVVRLFNTIGPRQVGHYGMVVPRFIERAVRNEAIEVYGDGEQTRAFCDVRDVVRAMTDLMNEPRSFSQVFNVGSASQVTIDDLASQIIAMTGSTGGKQLVPYEQVYGPQFEDPPHRLPDVSKIANLIDWQPQIGLSQTLEELVAAARAGVQTPDTVVGPAR